jgi:alcohol dehydrogenase
MTTMRAAFAQDSALTLRHDYPMPLPRGEEALLRVRLAGICATDIELLRGYKGGFCGVLGHEFVGEVVAAPSAPLWEGKRVVGEINVGCGACALCRRGLGRHCRRRTSLGIIGRDGVFADYALLPVQNLHAVPDHVPDEMAVFTEPLAAAYELLEQIPFTPTQRVIIQGDGRLGLLCAFVLAQTGCDLTVLGRHAAKAGLARRRWDSHTGERRSTVLAQLAAAPADVVVEATGARSGFATALNLVRPGGRAGAQEHLRRPPRRFRPEPSGRGRDHARRQPLWAVSAGVSRPG